MQELIKKTGITSLELVSEINFFRSEEGDRTEMRHDTLLSIIRDEFDEEISLQKILESTYTNERGRQYPMFELTKSQATQILARESKFVRRGIVAKLDRLEESSPLPALTREQKLAESLVLAHEVIAETKAENEQLKTVNAKLLPRAEYTDKVLQSDKTYTATNMAKSLGMSSAQVLNDKLCEKKVQYWHDDMYVLSAKYSKEGFHATRTGQWLDKNGVSHTNTYLVWTERGKAFLHFLFNEQLSYGKPAKAKRLALSPQSQLYLNQAQP